MKYDEFYERFYVKECRVDRVHQVKQEIGEQSNRRNRKGFWSLRLHSKKYIRLSYRKRQSKGDLKVSLEENILRGIKKQ